MVRDAKKVRKNLLRKGFVEEQQTQHIFYKFMYKGKKAKVKTFMSRNGQDLDDYLLARMQKQLMFENRADFIDFIDCYLDEDYYIKLLKSQGLLQEDEEE